MNFKIAVCDDDQGQTEYLTEIVKSWGISRAHICAIDTFPSAEAFLFTYSEDKNWDILLLDVEMGGINGVELAKTVRQDNTRVQMVFITGFPDFMAEGYEVSALHYLLKPVDLKKLYSVLDKAAENLSQSEKRLCVSYDRQTIFLPLSKITHIEAQKQYVVIYTEADSYKMKTTLTDTEKQLDKYFFKCQRSFIVNLSYIVRIKPDCVELKNGCEVPLSRGMAEKIGKEIIRLF